MWLEFLTRHSWTFALLLVCLALSAFFSGSETAIFSLSRGQLYRFRQSRGAAGRVASLMDRPARLLNAILLGNMIASTAYAGVSAVLVVELERTEVSHWLVAAASILPLLVLLLVGEITPKMLGYLLREQVSLAAAGPLAVIQRAMTPLLRVFEAAVVEPLTSLIAPRPGARQEITAGELSEMLELAAQRGILHHEASALLQEIVELTDLRAGDVMAPRVDMAAYDVDGPAEGLLELFRTTHLRRIPVYEKDVDHVLGVVPAKRLLLGDPRPLRQLVEKTPFVPEAANLERVLVLFRVTRTQMAIVVDEYGGTAGVVSMQDVLEEIVGDLPDPYEAPHGPAVERISEREYRLDGDLAIHDWADVFGMDLSGKRISTIGGFILSRLGHIPRVGESVDYRNLRFTVLSMRGRRIEKAALELREEAK